jgi:hypothetical protein
MAEFQGLYGFVLNREILEPCETTTGRQRTGGDQPNHEGIAIWCSSACDRRGPERHTKVIKKFLANLAACSSRSVDGAL